MNAIPVRLIRAGVVTGISDGFFSSVLVTVFYGSTFVRLWQGVASTLLGRSAFDGGIAVVLLGLLMHFCVAFTWSAVFLYVVMRLGWVQRLLAGPYGVVKVAALYGPFVWLMMSLVVIPSFVGHLPTFNYRWWIQLVGHFPFVGIPIVASLRLGTPPPGQG